MALAVFVLFAMFAFFPVKIGTSLMKMSALKPKPNPAKAVLRKDVDGRIAAMTMEDKKKQSNAVVDKILNHPKYLSARRISLFLSLPSEVDTSPLLAAILARGAVPFVPQYSRGKMRMLRVLDGDLKTMVKTSWGIPQHGQGDEREDALETGGLDLVIAPGAAFTKDGWRLGHGGGYYDRYMTSLLDLHQRQPEKVPRPYLLGIGFKQQIYENVVVDSHDVKLDEVVTAE